MWECGVEGRGNLCEKKDGRRGGGAEVGTGSTLSLQFG